MFGFITRRSLFVKHNCSYCIGVFGLCFLFFVSLGSITRHDETIKVPSVTRQNIIKCQIIFRKPGFKVTVQDSVYIDSLAPLVVVKQSPESDEVVKINRTVYLTINRAQAPLIEMPDLLGFFIPKRTNVP